MKIPVSQASYDLLVPRLLVVTDLVAIEHVGVHLEPTVALEELPPGRHFMAEIRRPDGSRARAPAYATVTRANPTRAYVALNRLTAADVPIGTEVWTVDK
ncbi:MAG: hypothetical protein KF819_26470 [Labilithrix sp.]|nr:hypothetical protein [Labilithrix sp.]